MSSGHLLFILFIICNACQYLESLKKFFTLNLLIFHSNFLDFCNAKDPNQAFSIFITSCCLVALCYLRYFEISLN